MPFHNIQQYWPPPSRLSKLPPPAPPTDQSRLSSNEQQPRRGQILCHTLASIGWLKSATQHGWILTCAYFSVQNGFFDKMDFFKTLQGFGGFFFCPCHKENDFKITYKMMEGIHNCAFVLWRGASHSWNAAIVFIYFPFVRLFFFPPDRNICPGLRVWISPVRNLEIDSNSNIPQLMWGVFIFQAETARRRISCS